MATAAIIGGTALASGYMQSRAASKASKAQQQSANQANMLAQQRFEAIRETMMPFIESGMPALQMQQAMSGALGPEAQAQAFANYQESPGVAFAREQGLRGIENDAAMTGRGGGSRLKAITEFSQGLAMQDFNNQYNRLQNLAQQSISAAGSLAGTSATFTNAQTNAINQAGAARAGGIVGRANAWSGALSGLAGLAGGFGG